MTDPYGPKRRQTNPLPRVELPPTEGSVPDLADKHWDPNALTMEECPCCRACSLCRGNRLVPQEIAQAYREQMKDEEGDGG